MLIFVQRHKTKRKKNNFYIIFPKFYDFYTFENEFKRKVMVAFEKNNSRLERAICLGTPIGVCYASRACFIKGYVFRLTAIDAYRRVLRKQSLLCKRLPYARASAPAP